jgi:hypothetical protein
MSSSLWLTSPNLISRDRLRLSGALSLSRMNQDQEKETVCDGTHTIPKALLTTIHSPSSTPLPSIPSLLLL